MLRTAIAHGARVPRAYPTARCAFQCLPPRAQQLEFSRGFADAKKVDNTILPGSRSTNTVAGVPQPPVLDNQQAAKAASDPTIPPAAVPRTPPTPAEVGSVKPAALDKVDAVQASLSSLPPKKPRRRFRRFLLTLLVLSALGYAGGVYYSLVSDNFHDFFTEYVPFGEDAVAYFEEREFRKRFPLKETATKAWGQTRGENKVTIGRSSGLQAKVADVKSDASSQSKEHTSVIDNSKKAASATPTAASNATSGPPATAAISHTKPDDTSKVALKSEKPSTPKIAAVDHVNIEQAEEPAVQKLVKMINNVVTALNASPAGLEFGKVAETLKQDLNSIASEIGGLKSKHAQDLEHKVQEAHGEFDKAAKELVRRVEQEMREQELKWREEYETERENLSKSYQEKLDAELDIVKKIAEQKGTNDLLEQEIALQKKYMDLVRSKVEEERDGRLSKIDELSASVKDLETLTSEWDELVDTTLQTQHLQVAVEAVKAKVLHAEAPSPFVDELIALKGVSHDDQVVNAAISSINPVAYQHGIASPAHLIDRFRRVAAEVRKASLLPEDAGVASHAASAVLSRFMFQKRADRGLPAGDDVEATLARAEALLEEGDLDSAAREVNGLQGWAGVLSRDWVTECRRVLEVRQAVEVIATQARLKSLLVD